MDAARYAAQSDPERNYHFSRRWDAPPLKVKSPPTGGTVERAEFKVSSSSLEIARIFEKFKDFEISQLGIGVSDAKL